MLFITGTYPPQRCGVGDYLHCLLHTPTGSKWHLFYEKDWNIKNIFRICKHMKQEKDIHINLQYPTMGYGTHLTPHILCLYAVLFLRKKLTITIHEYSQLGWKGKLALKPLFHIADKVIFTTEFEREAAEKKNKIKASHIIKINSNITPATPIKNVATRNYDLGYFGYIRPDKGIEEFIDVAGQLKKQNLKIFVLGQIQPQFSDYADKILESLRNSNIQYLGDRDKSEVANILNDTKIMYLPYPDGLTERRGSFLAAIVNGCVVVSKEGPFTTNEHKRNFILVEEQLAAKTISELLNSEKLLEQQEKCFEFVKNNVPTSWENIAQQYEALIS